MPNIKRTTKKTGNNSKRTITISSTGTKTESYSNKPTKQSPRRTVSFNHKTGNRRTTYSQKLGGGWTRISTKTIKTNKAIKPKSSNRRSVSRSSGFSTTPTSLLPLLIIPTLLFLSIMYFFPVTIPWILGGILCIFALVIIFKIILFLLPWAILSGIIYLIYSILS